MRPELLAKRRAARKQEQAPQYSEEERRQHHIDGLWVAFNCTATVLKDVVPGLRCTNPIAADEMQNETTKLFVSTCEELKKALGK